MTAPTYAQLKAYREDRGLPWFDALYDLNLVILRDEEVGNWGDWICLAFTDETGQQVVEAFQSSADAWDGEWTDPTHPGGCIFIVDQHVVGGYAPGPHNGRPAIRQVRPFTYVRWPPGKGYKPTVRELEARRPRHEFEAIRNTNLHDRVSDRQPDRPARDDSEGCPLTRSRASLVRIRALAATQKRHVGTDAMSPTFGRLKDLR